MKKPDKKTPVSNSGLEWKSRGIRQKDALFPVCPGSGELPENYTAVLGEIKERIQTERLRVVMAANAAMVLLYWGDSAGRFSNVRSAKVGGQKSLTVSPLTCVRLSLICEGFLPEI
jgi:hypothetical protein